jgi:hypothetical protein
LSASTNVSSVSYFTRSFYVTIELPMCWPEPAQYLAGRQNLWIPSYNIIYEEAQINSVALSWSWLECC